jgi:hypothetical protein
VLVAESLNTVPVALVPEILNKVLVVQSVNQVLLFRA